MTLTTEPKVIRCQQHNAGVEFTDTAGIVDADGVPVPLTDCVVYFTLHSRRESAPMVEELATIVDAEAQTVFYVTTATDLERAGLFRQKWQVVFDDGSYFTVPSEGHNLVIVDPNDPPVEAS